jgi:rsbT co-antagonist protein RsbR
MPTVSELQERITELEEALHQSEKRYRAVAETALAGIGVSDPEENMVFANSTFAEMLGYTRDELIGMNLSQLTSPEEFEGYQERTQEREQAGVRNQYETVMRHKDGHVVNVLVSASPLTASDGTFEGTVGVLVDITERKRAEEKLRQAYAEMERRVVERTAALKRGAAERERLQQEVIEAQGLALRELGTPVIPILDTPRGNVVVVPLVGNIDSIRAIDIMRALLGGIHKYEAKIVILDITGVAIVDTGVVNHLNKTIQAARLKGAHTIVTGITEAMAETIVELGIDWGSIDTLCDLQTGLIAALDFLGVKLIWE